MHGNMNIKFTFLFDQVHYTAYSLGSNSDRIVKIALPRSSIRCVLRLTWNPSTIESSRTKSPLHDIIQGDAWSNVLDPGTGDSVSLVIVCWSSGQKHYADDDQYKDYSPDSNKRCNIAPVMVFALWHQFLHIKGVRVNSAALRRNFRLPPWCKWDLPSSGMLRTVGNGTSLRILRENLLGPWRWDR